MSPPALEPGASGALASTEPSAGADGEQLRNWHRVLDAKVLQRSRRPEPTVSTGQASGSGIAARSFNGAVGRSRR